MAEINKILFKRGLETNRTTITPAEGEPIWVTDEKRLYMGDGSTLGGVPVAGTLNDLADTTITTPADGALLLYDTGTSAWRDATMSGDATIDDVGAVTIAGDAVTYAKIQNVAANNVLLGNDNGAGSAVQELSAADVRTLLNVADGANNYTFSVDSDANSAGAVASGSTVSIDGGAGIATSRSGTTITVDMDIPSLAAPAGGIVDGDSFVVYDASGVAHTEVLASELKTYINAAAGTFSSFDAAGNTGVVATVTDGQRLNIIGTTATGISVNMTDSTGTSPYNATISLDITGLAAASALQAADSFAIYDSSATGYREATVTQLQTYMDANLAFTKAGTAETITGGWTFGTAQTTFTANTRYNDNVVLNLGTGDDVKHFFNATAYITELESVDWIVRDNADAAIMTVTESTRKVTFAQDVDVGKDLVVTGDLTVNGTTTTVNSTTVTVDDPIITLGGDTAPGADDNKDRGIEFRWHNGTSAKVGFFGYDDSISKFTFIPDATNTSEVFSGTAGDVVFNTLESSVSTGTAPLIVASTTLVTNLNADQLDGNEASAFTLEFVTGNGASSTNAITISNITNATSDATGALIVAGGIGVSKDINGSGAATSNINDFTIDGGTF